MERNAQPDPPVLFNVGALSLASLSAAAVFEIGRLDSGFGQLVTAAAGLVAGAVYFFVNTGLLRGAMALEGHDSWRRLWNERFSWLLPHYVAFGAVAGAIALAYEAIGLYGLAVFVLPLLLMRKTMAAYLGHTQRSSSKLREAAETIRCQNASLEQANRLLKERSTAAMESLSATVDARDAYTAGPFAARAAARARDRPRAGPLAGRARPARPRGALPRHRQARHPGRDPPQAVDA